MRPKKLLGLAAVSSLSIIGSGGTFSTAEQLSENSLIDSSDVGTGRYFPLLPPYYGVDFAANFNKLKSPGDTAYFVVRDTIVYVGVQIMWVILHSVIWDGEAFTVQDVITSLLSPGVKVPLSTPSKNSRLTFESLNEISLVKLWNFFADPNASTRNLYLSFGFAAAQQLLWIIPTFIGKIPDPDARREDVGQIDRLSGLPENLAEADPVAAWNRIFSPQGIIQIIGINTLLWLGRIVFWVVMSNLPDVPAASVITGRSLNRQKTKPADSVSFFRSVAEELVETARYDVELMIQSLDESTFEI